MDVYFKEAWQLCFRVPGPSIQRLLKTTDSTHGTHVYPGLFVVFFYGITGGFVVVHRVFQIATLRPGFRIV